MMEDAWRRLNIVWISSHFHLDGTSSRRSTELSPPAFPFDGSARDGCRYVAIEALFLRCEIGLRLFPLLPPRWLPLTRDSLPFRLVTCSKIARSQKKKKKKKKKYDVLRNMQIQRSDNYHTLKIREASLR